MMQTESSDPQDPKDEQITNQDTSITNADPDTDTEKGGQETEQNKPDDVLVPTVTPDNDSGDPGPSSDEPAVDKGENKASPTV
ncbi:MAG: hypothetical protein V4592_15395 [Bacteroidota bacterium]